VLIGEPGIGKTRMLQELAVLAEREGFAVVTGSCSQDEGAPPLWPWTRVLRALDQAVPIEDTGQVDLRGISGAAIGPGRAITIDPAESDIGQFGLWEAVARRLVVAAAERPVLLRIEDLHWADASTLKLLRHLVESVTDGRLAMVMTRRALPEPDGQLAGLGETLARHGTLRVPLTGLRPEDIRLLVEASTGRPADLQGAVELCDRTGGNPFFVTELIRHFSWTNVRIRNADILCLTTIISSIQIRISKQRAALFRKQPAFRPIVFGIAVLAVNWKIMRTEKAVTA
jgi:predicted ATPase